MAVQGVPAHPANAIPAVQTPGTANLRPGHVLSATVLGQTSEGQTRLATPAGTLNAHLPQPQARGAQLLLQVVSTAPDLKLAVLRPPAPTGNAQPSLNLSPAFANAIAAQNSQAPLFATLSAISGAAGQGLPSALQSLIGQLAGLRLSPESLSAQALGEAARNSGLLYEAKLASGATPTAIAADAKGLLLALRGALGAFLGPATASRPEGTKTPPPLKGAGVPVPGGTASAGAAASLPAGELARLLLSQSEAALARLRLAQLASLPDSPDQAGPRVDRPAFEWVFELPFAVQDKTVMVQFALSSDGEADQAADEHADGWRLRFSLDIDPLGPIHALVSLVQGVIDVTLWAETDEGRTKLSRHADELNASFQASALPVNTIEVRSGRPHLGRPVSGTMVDQVT